MVGTVGAVFSLDSTENRCKLGVREKLQKYKFFQARSVEMEC